MQTETNMKDMPTIEDVARYDVFTRTWYKSNPTYPRGLEPSPGRKHYIARNLTWGEAREYCKQWNASHNPGKFSRKAEFEAR